MHLLFQFNYRFITQCLFFFFVETLRTEPPLIFYTYQLKVQYVFIK